MHSSKCYKYSGIIYYILFDIKFYVSQRSTTKSKIKIDNTIGLKLLRKKLLMILWIRFTCGEYHKKNLKHWCIALEIQGSPQNCPYFSLAIGFTKIRKPSGFFLRRYWKFIEFFWCEPL